MNDEERRKLVADALTGEADRRIRAGVTAAAELEQERTGGKDIRTSAVRIVRLLAEAAALREQAAAMTAGDDVEVEVQTTLPVEDAEEPAPEQVVEGSPPPDEPPIMGDGTEDDPGADVEDALALSGGSP